MDSTVGRTRLGIRNARVALGFFIVNLLLTFISRKIFLDYLGADILGLNTTAQNLISVLNIAELGLGYAIAYFLYKPILQGERQSITEIIAIQGFYYRRIANVILGAAIAMMAFFPLIFKGSGFPFWYTYATFSAFLCNALFGYYWNYRQILLTADQKEYKNTVNRQGLNALKVIMQIIAIRYLAYGYVAWIALEFIFAALITLSLNRIIKRNYPWLDTSIRLGRAARHKYPELMVKTKQLFIHTLGDYASAYLPVILVFAFTSLATVAIYGNYWLIVLGVFSLMAATFNGLNASVGNLVADGDGDRIRKVFWELFSFRVLVVTVICFCIYESAQQFMTLWIGAEYLLSERSLILIVILLYLKLMGQFTDSFIKAYGIFQDVWAPAAEAVISIGIAITLGSRFGLDGVLTGFITGLFLIRICWKPFFLFRYGFRVPVRGFVVGYGVQLAAIAIAYILSNLIIMKLRTPDVIRGGWFPFIEQTLIAAAVYGFLTLTAMLAVSSGLRGFAKRLLKMCRLC